MAKAKTAALKEAKGDPWKVLANSAGKAEKPNAQKSWNTVKGPQSRKAGDTLMGTVGETKEAMTPFGMGKMLEITKPDGGTEALFLSKVLMGAIQSVGGFQKGDRVFVKYLGVPAGKRYGTYAVGKV